MSVSAVDKTRGRTGAALLLQRRWIQVRVGAAQGEHRKLLKINNRTVATEVLSYR